MVIKSRSIAVHVTVTLCICGSKCKMFGPFWTQKVNLPLLHMIFPGTLDNTRLLFRRQETLHFVSHDHRPAVGARASIQGLCCNSEDKFFPRICAKPLLTNPEHTGKYVLNDMKCTYTNCTHICGKSTQKRQYV